MKASRRPSLRCCTIDLPPKYFNRVQPAEWLAAFAGAGEVLIDQSRNDIDLNSMQIAARFREMEAAHLAW